VTSETKTILVVDDEFVIREVLTELLEWEGYTVLTATNGEEGLEQIAGARPSLVLLDFMMPVMDGLEMLRRLRADPALRDTPVVLMTAAPMSLRGDTPLWDALLPKPFDIEGLRKALKKAR
jgi:CheY-like chemotaxis protein